MNEAMTLLLLYQPTPSERLNQLSSSAFDNLKRFMKNGRFFYDKKRFSILLIHHYQFLLKLHQRFNRTPNLPIDSPLAKLPYLHCLRADIKDVCACCPLVEHCQIQSGKMTVCLGQVMAHFLIGDFYQHQHRRIDDYLGVKSGKRFFVLQLKNLYQQKLQFLALLNGLNLKAKDEGEVVSSCIDTLVQYTHELQAAATQN